MILNGLAREIHQTAIEHGWWDQQRSFGEVIALIHSEASEALEEYRQNQKPNETYWRHLNGSKVSRPREYPLRMLKPEGIPSEFADIIIRVLDACAAYDIDIDQAVIEKMTYNKTRPFRHGDKVA